MDPTDEIPPASNGEHRPAAGSGSNNLTLELSGGGETPSRPRAFPDGALVAGRYHILRFIAGGGMGDVYEAEDTELSSQVALKTLRMDSAAEPRALEQFKQEILLARKVTHPNVCRIFDVGWHRPAVEEGRRDHVMFLTMELLRGETLAEHLKHSGRMGEEEALPIVRQMAEALTAAHKAGVIHRDFKASNVMLVPSSEGPRAVVMDFGLARSQAGHPRLSDTDLVQGTPAYMAPEQLQGGSTTAATDVYALGVVLYEMLTGEMPFAGDTALSTALKHLQDRPSPPRHLAPDLSPKWESVILKCLERDPARRFQSPAGVVSALTGGAGAWRGTPASIWAYLGAGTLVLLVIAAAFFWATRHDRRAPAHGLPSPAKLRPSVAVLDFKNTSGRPENAWLSTALAEMITTELAAGDALRTIPGENVSRARRDLAIGDWDSLARDTLTKLGANLGADFIVLGSFVVIPQKEGALIRVDARLQETATGEILTSVPAAGSASGLLEIASSTGAALRGKLGANSLSAGESGSAKASMPSNPEASRLYAEGLERLRLLEFVDAQQLLDRAAAAEPSSPLIHAALATAWHNLGYDAKARKEAGKAYDLSSALPREERLAVEARYRAASGDWAKAADISRALWGFYPDNLQYGLDLASALTKSGKGTEALDTLAHLRTLPQSISSDPRIDLAEAEALSTLGDSKRQQAVSAQAAKKGTALGARQVVAKALYFEAGALRKMGDKSGAMAAAEDSKREYLAVGDRQGAAYAQGVVANICYSSGDFEKSRQLSEENLRLCTEIGDQRGKSVALNSLANAAYAQGRLAEAARMYEAALKVALEVDDKSAATKILGNLANTLQLKGDLKSARQRHEEVLTMCMVTGDGGAPPFAQCGLGEIELAEGNPAKALERYEQALRTFEERDERSGAAYAEFGLAETFLAQGKLKEARAKQEEALRQREGLGEKSAAAESRCSLSRMALEEGRPQEAEELARRSAAEFRKEESPDEEAFSLAALARVLLREGRPAEALKVAREALALVEKSAPENTSYRQEVGITLAMAMSATGSSAKAGKRLESIAAESGAQGRTDRNMEARLALGQLLVATGEKERGLLKLEELKEEATGRGLILVAQKASEASGGTPQK